MFREVLRSTLYSSSRPFSSSATRRSSFSTLIINLLPVFGEPKPKMRFTLSIIIGERVCDHERSVALLGRARFRSRIVHLRAGGRFGGGVGAGTGVGFGRAPKSRSKKLGFRGGGVATGIARTTFLPAT